MNSNPDSPLPARAKGNPPWRVRFRWAKVGLLVVLVAHWLYVWRNGAYVTVNEHSPFLWVTCLAAGALAVLNLFLYLVAALISRNTARERAAGWLRFVVMALVALCLPSLLDARPIRNAAFHRDLDGRLTEWADGVLRNEPPPDRLIVPRSTVPFFVNPSPVGSVIYVRPPGHWIHANRTHLVIDFGGGMSSHAGYLVGPKDLVATVPGTEDRIGAEDESRTNRALRLWAHGHRLQVKEIEDGVYWFRADP